MFSERIRILRKEAGLTQAQAAQKVGLSSRGYQDLELGANPRGDTLVSLADFYGVSLDWLMGRTDVRAVNAPGGGPAHRIILEAEVEVPEGTQALLEEVITAALAAEGVSLPCEINVLLTDDGGIHQVNLDMHVLSFPMFDLRPGERPQPGDEDPETGLVPLGDMCISLERAAAQAAEFGHSVKRELAYLTVHSALHLLGYDHMDEGPMKRQMRLHEEFILDKLGITRETEQEEQP